MRRAGGTATTMPAIVVGGAGNTSNAATTPQRVTAERSRAEDKPEYVTYSLIRLVLAHYRNYPPAMPPSSRPRPLKARGRRFFLHSAGELHSTLSGQPHGRRKNTNPRWHERAEVVDGVGILIRAEGKPVLPSRDPRLEGFGRSLADRRAPRLEGSVGRCRSAYTPDRPHWQAPTRTHRGGARARGASAN